VTEGGPAPTARRTPEQAVAALTGRPPAGRLFVPGRIEVLGKHTDYAGGRSLTCAVERGFTIAFAPRPDAVVRIVDASDGRSAEFPLAPDLEPVLGQWANYPMTVARRLSRNFPELVHGADIGFLSTLPRAAGLSTSSALIIATYLVLEAANDLAARPEYAAEIGTPEALAGYLGSIENGKAFGGLAGDHGVGTSGGSQDHTAILLSEAGHLGCYQYGPVALMRRIRLDDDLVFVVGASGIAARKTGPARERYNRASALVTTLVAEWRAATGGSQTTLAQVLASAPDAPDRLRAIVAASRAVFPPEDLRRRLDHFLVEERELLPAALDALASGALDEFGRLAGRSQRAAETLLGNQVPETVALARLAREHGALAASAFGAGFGGSVWALVGGSDAPTFMDAWARAYAAQFPEAASRGAFFVTRPARGAGPVV
jgi:galactokinase